jgi:hypothetical protein
VQHDDDIFRSISLGAVEAIKNKPGRMTGYYLFNYSTSVLHVKIFDALAADVVLGTTTPKMTISLPAEGGANVLGERELGFDTGISIACTAGLSDGNSTVAGANEVSANIYYNQ